MKFESPRKKKKWYELIIKEKGKLWINTKPHKVVGQRHLIQTQERRGCEHNSEIWNWIVLGLFKVFLVKAFE